MRARGWEELSQAASQLHLLPKDAQLRDRDVAAWGRRKTVKSPGMVIPTRQLSLRHLIEMIQTQLQRLTHRG